MVGIIMVLLLIVILYNYRDTYKELIQKLKSEKLDINDYFFKDIRHLSSKRKLWIHLPVEKNSRNWRQIRGSYDMNLDYIALCVKSIIDYCGQYYDIILLEDANFSALLGNDIDYQKLSGELLETYRQRALLQLIYKYGGVVLPCSMYMRKSIYSVDKPNYIFCLRTAQPRIKLLVRNLCIFNQIMGVKRQESYLSVGHTFFFKRFDERDRLFYALVFEKNGYSVSTG